MLYMATTSMIILQSQSNLVQSGSKVWRYIIQLVAGTSFTCRLAYLHDVGKNKYAPMWRGEYA
jgi:hypothetical protein